MKFLLDTKVFLWAVSEEHKLNSRAREILRSTDSKLYFSAVSSWEIAIKFASGWLPLPRDPSEYIANALSVGAVGALSITHEHALLAGKLPAHHRDPFDRMLIAQARLERLVMLTGNRVFKAYEVEMIFCGRR